MQLDLHANSVLNRCVGKICAVSNVFPSCNGYMWYRIVLFLSNIVGELSDRKRFKFVLSCGEKQAASEQLPAVPRCPGVQLRLRQGPTPHEGARVRCLQHMSARR